MSNSNNLLFFNKEGYPHNFQYNTCTESWEGKIIFDENSDQTFKTQSLHIFENVDPIDFSIEANLISMNYNNNSGLTIAGNSGFSYGQNEIITDIIKVNESNEFYSKWIFGDNFHKKFPVGTVVSFSGVTGSTEYLSDFSDDQYFTVLGVKKNAFLIITDSSNDIFNFIFISGQTTSLSMISINDYNRNLYDQTLFQNLYTGKNISIINSDYNSTVVSVKQSGITYSYLTEFELNGSKDQIFTLQIQLFDERPKVFQGDVTLVNNIYFNLGRFAYLLAPETIYTSSGESLLKNEIIFEDVKGNQLYSGYTFVVDSLVTTEYLGVKQLTFQSYQQKSNNYQYNSFITNTTQWNTIQFNGNLGINTGDFITLTSDTLSELTGSTYLMNNRQFSISNVSYNSNTDTTVLFTPGYIINENNSSYNITKNLQPQQMTTVSVTPSGDVTDFNNITIKDAYCYLTSSMLELSQTYVTGTTSNVDSSTIDTFINKYKTTLFQYGIDIYHTIRNNTDYLSVESIYGTKSKYFTAIGYTNNQQIPNDYSLSLPQTETVTLSGTTGELLITDAGGIITNMVFDTDLNTTSSNFVSTFSLNYLANNIIITSDGPNVVFKSNDSNIEFTPPNVLNIIGDLNGVLKHTYSVGLTQKYDIIVNEKLYDERTNRSSIGLYKTNVPTEILFNLNNDNDRFGFRITLNNNQYYTNFVTNTQNTINNFIDFFGTALYSNGFIVSSGFTTGYEGCTGCTGYTLNIQSDVDIWNIEVMVNILSSYQIIQQNRNRAILLSANELVSLYANLFDIQLSTGMIFKISGSSYNENNKEYNIISLTEKTIGLSYQGVLITEYDATIYGKSRDYIRKPRGEYDRDIKFKVYWETPLENSIDESIFLYDISGDHLTPFNNIQNLKYIGPTPLVDALTNNVVFLNSAPNTDINRVSNPKYQQTVFTGLTYKLEQLDSSLSYNWVPEPLEIYVGYNSKHEGVNTKTLIIEKNEYFQNTDIPFSYSGYTNSGSSISIPNFTFDNITLTYAAPIDFNFISYGFNRGQLINFTFNDKNNQNETIFENTYTYRIQDISRNKIIIDSGYTYKNNVYDSGYTYQSTGFTYFNTTGKTFFFKIEVQPKIILTCPLYGQTEIEDVRYKVNLNNVGIQLEDDVYKILYLSDIEDNAVDYTLFNRKRKEMLTDFREIYDYIGSYKALINAINFFGYNSLQLYEYYKNVNPNSSLVNKLHKVLIPDIFDNSVLGWNETDFIGGKYQNQNNWKKTNLFNLSYQITDEEGNNVLIYTLDEVQYKLTGLKKWLRNNIIPISSNLLDITGVADTVQTLYQDYDESSQTKKFVINRDSTVVNFNYTATLNFGTDYLISVNFYTMYNDVISTKYSKQQLNYLNKIISTSDTGNTYNINDVPLNFTAKIKTFYLSGHTILNPTNILIPVQYFKINKNDLTSFSFNINKDVDPYIYIETTTYDNNGSGLGYVNNKLFYYDEPRNYWLINNNFDLSKMIYWQTTDIIDNSPQKYMSQNIITQSNVVSSSVETIVNVNTLNNTYTSSYVNNNTN